MRIAIHVIGEVLRMRHECVRSQLLQSAAVVGVEWPLAADLDAESYTRGCTGGRRLGVAPGCSRLTQHLG